MLPARDERVAAVHALLRLASHISIGPDMGGGILPSSAAVLEAPGSKAHPGAFSGLRLLRGKALEAAAPALRIWLAEKLLEDPPHEMRWLGVAGDDLKASLHLALLLPQQDARIDSCRETTGRHASRRHTSCEPSPTRPPRPQLCWAPEAPRCWRTRPTKCWHCEACWRTACSSTPWRSATW